MMPENSTGQRLDRPRRTAAHGVNQDTALAWWSNSGSGYPRCEQKSPKGNIRVAAIRLDELHTLRKETSRLTEIETRRVSLRPHRVWTAKDSPQIVGVVTPVLRQGLQS